MMRDITIGQYYPADSILHRLDPRVKFVSTLVYIVSLFVFSSWLGYGVAALFLVAMIVLHDYPNKIVNIHPALLPKFGGKGMYGSRVHQAVIASHEKESGITIHYINERYDEGNTIFQATCPVLPTDTPDTLAIRVHQLEYEYFPRVIEATILGKNLSI